jgi:hypothetical protein
MQAMEVDNHVSNTKYCLSRLLSDHGKEPLYQKVVQAKSIQDLCDVLQVKYAGVPNEMASRGENSTAAKAAGGDMTHRHEPKITRLRGVSYESTKPSFGEVKQTALSV